MVASPVDVSMQSTHGVGTTRRSMQGPTGRPQSTKPTTVQAGSSYAAASKVRCFHLACIPASWLEVEVVRGHLVAYLPRVQAVPIPFCYGGV